MGEATFVTCICLQKRLVLEHREQKQREQREQLAQIIDASACQTSALLPGGCLLALGAAIGQAVGFAAAVLGKLSGRENLINTFLPELTSQPAGEIKDAELICHLYKKLGRTVPQKLLGDFTFVLFDPVQERVLAAVSPTSNYPLIQARDPEGNLILTTQPPSSLPVGSHSMLVLNPGYMKYGWSSEPQQYMPTTQGLQLSPSARLQAARLALEEADSWCGEGQGDSQASVQTSAPSFPGSEGGEAQSPGPKKTRRGKRGGRNQKLRAESLKRQPGDELSRPSLDQSSIPSASVSPRSMSSRADEQNWWRTNTPRQSLDLQTFPTGSPSTYGSAPSQRRFSMSATAPPFIPGQSAFFSRQSVPAVKARTTALSFPERTLATRLPPNEPFVTGHKADPGRTSEEGSLVSPFSATNLVEHGEIGPPPAGKADAAWEEAQGNASWQAEAKQSSEASRLPDFPASESLAAGTSRSSWTDSLGSQVLGVGSDKAGMGDTKAATGLHRLVVAKKEGPAGCSPKGGSPRGSSPRPPKIPGGGFMHFWKSVLPKRASQVDLWAEAGPTKVNERSWAKSSSHGNLVQLHSKLAHNQPASDDTQRVTSREDTARQSLGRMNMGHKDIMLRDLKPSYGVGDPTEGHATTAAQWIARQTRNMFGKSKSCNDLHQIGAAAPAATEVK